MYSSGIYFKNLDISGLVQSDELHPVSAGVVITANGPPLAWNWIVQHGAVTLHGLIHRFTLLLHLISRLDAAVWPFLSSSAAGDSARAVIVEKVSDPFC